jgi:hypothetical protein
MFEERRVSSLSSVRKSNALGIICGGLSTLLGTAIGLTLVPMGASALPLYARQTGQPCAACHTTFPELTPFGRRFKLGGYTLGGTRCGSSENVSLERDAKSLKDYLGATDKADATDVRSGGSDPRNLPAVSFMLLPAFAHVNKSFDAEAPFRSNDNLAMQEMSIFFGGQVYCDFGAFVQATHEPAGYSSLFLDNVDLRYAKSTKIGGMEALFGLTVNNSPTVQDIWNTTPAWRFPQAEPGDLAPGPAAQTMLEGTFAGTSVGTGVYAFLNDMLYLELSGYRTMNTKTLSALGIDPDTDRTSNWAPYWRVAIEKNWQEHSLMVGTLGMIADIYPGGDQTFGADRFTDVGFDTQYQYIGTNHQVTLKASYIYEWQKRNATFASGSATNDTDHLASFRASAMYSYEFGQQSGNRVAFTGGYFNTRGSADAVYGTFNSSPNTEGWVADFSWLPFNRGNIAAWPWLNARLGLQYTAYTQFDGASKNYDGAGRNASDNNTTYLYFWVAF